MIGLGLRRAELRAFHRELAGTHGIRVRIGVLTLDHDAVGDLSEEFLDGQVNIDADAEVTRSVSLTFLDRSRTIDFDSDSPSNGALYADRMLRISYGVQVPEIDEWVHVPLFCGPVTKLDRAGDEVSVECQGKEYLALGSAWQPLTIKKGTPKVDAIRTIMRERGGEHRFEFPDLAARLPKAVSLARDSQPWKVAQRIARSMDRQLFYDGRGVLRLRRFPGNPVFTFTDEQPRAMVMTPPQVAFSTDGIANAVWVKGGVPKHKKADDEPAADGDKKDKERGVRHFETAPRSHPLSPWRLGRPDAPHFRMEVIENKHIRSQKEAREAAQGLLRRRLRQLVEVTFDSLPTPHLEPEDLIRVDTGQVGMEVRLGQASVPLKHDQVQSVGYLAKVSTSRRKRHRK